MNALRFRFAGFPVEVAPTALILLGVFFLLGLSWQWSLTLVLAAVGIALVSVLLHELGHATLARLFGLDPIEITLHGMGGHTKHRASGSPGKDLAIILAGPGFGLLLAGAGAVMLLAPLPEALREVFVLLVGLNVFWSVFNLLPIFPMDGGQALSSFLQLFLPQGTAWPITWGVGLLGALAIGGLALALGEIFILFFAGMFAWRNVQMLQWWRARSREP